MQGLHQLEGVLAAARVTDVTLHVRAQQKVGASWALHLVFTGLGRFRRAGGMAWKLV